MRRFLLLLLTFTTGYMAYAQEFWTPTGNLSPAGDDWVPAIACNLNGTLFAYSHNTGIFRSTNSGDEWSLSGITNRRVSSIDISSDNKVFAICNNTSGIYIQLSTDDGLSWDEVYSAQHTNNYFSGSGMVFVDSSTLVAAISFTMGPTVGDIGVEIVRSTDGGNNWQRLGVVSSWGGAESLVKLDDGRILAATTLSGISYSSDNGSSWHSMSSFPPYFISRIKSNSTGDIFIGRSTAESFGELVYRSTDKGISWQGVGLLSGPNGGEIRAIYIDNNDRIYVSLNSGSSIKLIYRSTDNGSTWQELTGGMPSSQLVYSITGNVQDIIFAGTQSSGVYKGSDSVPVELISFTVNAVGNKIYLNWATASETNNSGFAIERAYGLSPDGKIINQWSKRGFIEGSGTTTGTRSYSFIDENVSAGIYSYRLKQIDYDGTFEYYQAIETEVLLHPGFLLKQNYPNPFNPSTIIEFSVPADGNVKLNIYNELGEEIYTLVDGYKQAGEYKINFNAKDLPAGVYFYRINAGVYTSSRKMIILR